MWRSLLQPGTGPQPFLLPATHSRGGGRGGKGPVPVRGSWDGPGLPSGTHLRPVAAAASLVIGGVPGEGWAVSGCSEGKGLPHGAAPSCLILSPHSWVGGTQFQHMILLKITRAIIPATELGACAGGDLERNRTSGEQVRVQVCAPKRTPSDGGPASLLSQGPEPLSAFISLDWLCLKQMERSPELG